MSGEPIGPEPDGATPLTDDELVELIPAFVATRGDLDVVEFENIVRALPWAVERARVGGAASVLDRPFVFELHRRMFGDVWKWAGRPRRRITNIGVDPIEVTVQTEQALADCRWWHDNDVFPIDERAARLHHRLVVIHPFANGNGRCTRLVADLYLVSTGEPQFTWGTGARLEIDSTTRAAYLAALRAADREDFAPLVAFARS